MPADVVPISRSDSSDGRSQRDPRVTSIPLDTLPGIYNNGEVFRRENPMANGLWGAEVSSNRDLLLLRRLSDLRSCEAVSMVFISNMSYVLRVVCFGNDVGCVKFACWGNYE